MLHTINKKCLLITPIGFYSFASHLIKALSNQNYDTVLVNDEYPKNMLGKIMGKLKFPLSLMITEKVITKNYLKNKKYDIVIIVKGRGMSKSLLAKFKIVSPKVIAYNFDSFKYHSAPLRWYKHVDKFYTFDYKDSENYSVPIAELFSSIDPSKERKQIIYSFSAILRNHSNRLNYINKVSTALNKEDTFIYIFEKDIFTFAYNFARNPILYFKFIRSIHFKPLSYEKYKSVLENSNFTIDYAHPKQTGITIRCFEALSTQTKIITNNSYILRNPNFTFQNTILFDEKSCKIDLVKHYEIIRKIIPARVIRSTKDFIDNLISNN